VAVLFEVLSQHSFANSEEISRKISDKIATPRQMFEAVTSGTEFKMIKLIAFEGLHGVSWAQMSTQLVVRVCISSLSYGQSSEVCTNSTGQKPPSETKSSSAGKKKNSSPFKKPEGSLPSSQEPATGPYAKPHEFSTYPQILFLEHPF